MILALKSASDQTEMYLLDSSGVQKDHVDWESGRRLSDELLQKIDQLLTGQRLKLSDLTGLIVFRGPGSFTSLRIGIATINTLAYSLQIPCVGAEGEAWLKHGLKTLADTKSPQIIAALYDRDANTTLPKK